MLKQIREFGCYVEITAFRGVDIKDPERFLEAVNRRKQASVEVQCFDASLVATWEHLFFATVSALTSIRNKANISKKLAMEILLYAAAERQIVKAMEKMGIKPNSSSIAILIIGKKSSALKATLSTISQEIDAQEDERILALSKEREARIRCAFDIGDTELGTIIRSDDNDRALVDLIIEKMALLSTQR